MNANSTDVRNEKNTSSLIGGRRARPLTMIYNNSKTRYQYCYHFPMTKRKSDMLMWIYWQIQLLRCNLQWVVCSGCEVDAWHSFRVWLSVLKCAWNPVKCVSYLHHIPRPCFTNISVYTDISSYSSNAMSVFFYLLPVNANWKYTFHSSHFR